MNIFWRIFLSCWLAILVIFLFVFSNNRFWPAGLIRATSPPVRMDPIALKKAVDAFEQHGVPGFMTEVQQVPAIGRSVMLFGADSGVLAPAGIPDQRLVQLVSETLKTGAPGVTRYDTMVALAAPVESSSGRRYVTVLTATVFLHDRLHRPTFWTKVAVAMVPVSLICLGLAFFITRPLHSLRLTATQLAGGDLSARPPADQKRRRDEVGQLSRDFDRMAGQIAELLAAQRRFVANVAHEFGAPLTRLQLAATLLHRDLPPAHAGSLLPIQRDTDRLTHLVQELLFLATLQEGVLPDEGFVPTSLSDLCRETVRDNAAEAEEKDCAILTDLEDVQIDAAPQTLRRAIENVLRNAIRHSSNASVCLSCKGGVPGYAVLQVNDQGPGVPEDMLSRIFQPFFRVPSQGHESRGTGLGLTIAADAVALHGGKIVAANGPRGGLIVTVTLPCKWRGRAAS